MGRSIDPMGGSGAALSPPRTLIVSMSLRPGIPGRVALQQSPLPLPRLGLSCEETVVKARLLQRMATCPFFRGLNKRPHSSNPFSRRLGIKNLHWRLSAKKG